MQLIKNLYSPIVIRSAICRAGVMFHAGDVCDALGVDRNLDDTTPVEYHELDGKQIAMVTMDMVKVIAHKSELPYVRDLIDWLLDEGEKPLVEALDAAELKIYQFVAAAEDPNGVTRNQITRRTQKMTSDIRSHALTHLVNSCVISAHWVDGKNTPMFRVTKGKS